MEPCADISSIISILAILVTLLIYALTAAREAHTRFVDNFNKLYNSTFSLRDRLSSIVQNHSCEEFFYETDRILECEALRNAVLDYLTEMEDFFFLIIGHRTVYRSFEKLMSLALYERLSAFYGFILRYRRETNNYSLFQNYEEVLLRISKMKKIQSQLPDPMQRIYVGIRSSDCNYNNHFFQSDICIFSDNCDIDVFPVRPNQNKSNKYVIPHVANRIAALTKSCPDCFFYFYNNAMAYNFNKELYNQFTCLNDKGILQLLNNKTSMKYWFATHHLPILPCETFLGKDISLVTLAERFPGNNRYVIQSNFGGGGMGTFLVSAENFDAVVKNTLPLEQYLVSAYMEHSISVNTHIFISSKQTVLTPGSIQIIEQEQNQLCYRGADYITFRMLPSACRKSIKELSLNIANRLRAEGYRGVAGLDFLVDKNHKVYCMEVNPRFQASSILLDFYLSGLNAEKNSASSVFALNEQAFYNVMVTPLCFEDSIDYSCYYYYKGDIPLDYFLHKRKTLLDENVIIHDDGFLQYAKSKRINNDSYLFRAVFHHSICGISPDMTLWINDNIPVRPAPKDLLDLKIALLNQGVRLEEPATPIKKGAYESIDIAYQGPYSGLPSVVMNCASQVNLAQYSPFSLSACLDRSVLAYYGVPLGHAIIETDQLSHASPIDKRILYLATDRLRIKLVAGCEFKNIGRGCKFCNLPTSDKRFTRLELKNALNWLKKQNVSFRHILIGGGSCLESNVWDDIVWLCQYLKADNYYQSKPISLMSILPPREMLSTLHEAGLEEVAFNMEVADDAVARDLMPGKRSHPKTTYYSILKEAVEVFGVGSVRSALLVGIDKEDELINEVMQLASNNIIPCLSALRSLPGSEYANTMHPDNSSLRRVYDTASKQLSTLDGRITELGPKCPACRNNMLIL